MPRDVLYEIRFRNKRNKNLRLTIMPPDNVPFPVAPVIKTLHVDSVNAISETGTPFDPVLSGSNKYEGLPLGFPLIPTLKLRVDLDKFDMLDDELKDLRDYLINPIVAATDGLFKGDGQPVELTPIFTLYDHHDKILFRGVIRRDPKSKYTFNRGKGMPLEINLAHIFRVVLESTRIEDVVAEYDKLAVATPALAPRKVQRIYDFAYWGTGNSGVVAQAQIGKYGNSNVEMIPYVGFQQAMFTHAQRIYRQFMRNPNAKFFADNTVFAGIDFFQQPYHIADYNPQQMPKTYAELFALVGTPAWKLLPVDSLYFCGYEYVGVGTSATQRPASATGMMTDMEGGFGDKGDAWTLLSRFVNGLGRKATVVYGYDDDLITVFYPYGKSLFITKTSVPPSIGGISTIVLHHFINEPPTVEEGAEVVAGVEITTKYVEEDSADRTQHRIELEGSENDENWSAELVLNNMPMVGKSDMSDRTKGEPQDFNTSNVALVHWKGFNRTGLFYFAKPDFATDNMCFRVNDAVGLDAEFVSKRPLSFSLPEYSFVKDNWENARRSLRDAAVSLQGTSCLGLAVGGLIMQQFTSSESTTTNTADGFFAVKVVIDTGLLVGLPGVIYDGQVINNGDCVLYFPTGGDSQGIVYEMTPTGFQNKPDSETGSNIIITSGSHTNETWGLVTMLNEYGLPYYNWTLTGIAEPVVTTRIIPKRGFILTAKIANDELSSTYIQEGVPVTDYYNLVDLSRVGERYKVERLRSYLTQIPENGVLTNVDSDYIEDTNSINILLF